MHKKSSNPMIYKERFTLAKITLPVVLPTEVSALTALLHSVIEAHNASNARAHEYINHLIEQFILARRRMFGASSEQSAGQGQLFNEAEVLDEGSARHAGQTPIPSPAIDIRVCPEIVRTWMWCGNDSAHNKN
ncbi:MAG: transposase [Sheuella sp.]|nr:transposase [Sheuella sp.]